MKRAIPVLFLTLLAACGPKKMNEEAVAYAKSIEFRNARLSALQAYSGETMHYLRIDVRNTGQRAVRQLEVVLYFYDRQNKLVNTERAIAVSERHRPLAPGETRDFKQGIEFPPDWNRVTPNIGISYLELK